MYKVNLMKTNTLSILVLLFSLLLAACAPAAPAAVETQAPVVTEAPQPEPTNPPGGS